MTAYDVIVLGTGGVGSAAAFHLARRGLRVLGLDRFPGGHDQGSSHGQSRIIRKAYFEHPSYVPLLQRAYTLWRELEAIHGKQLLWESGLIEIGPPDGVVIPGVRQSTAEHQLDVVELAPKDFEQTYRGFRLPPGADAVFEREAGFLLVEDCVLAHLSAAADAGAEFHSGQEVIAWNATAGGVTVQTTTTRWHARKLVITAGAWARDLLRSLRIPLDVRRQHLHWFACDATRYHQQHGCPAFFYETGEGFFYGFPQIDERGLKVAAHGGGTLIQDPLRDDKSVDPAERARVERFLRRHLPGVDLRPLDHAVCYYTNSADDHFIVDRHPRHHDVSFAAGLSGHGFKFASVLGEVLADLTLHGQTSLPIDFLACDRPGLGEN